LLTRLRTPWRSLNGYSLGDARLWVLDCAELGSQSLHCAWRARGVRELTCPVPHNMYGAMVPRSSHNLDPPHWGPTKGTVLFRFWCAQELGPNDCRNLHRDALREVKAHFIIIQVGCFFDAFHGAWTSSVHSLVG
jgi:hypothetical protein